MKLEISNISSISNMNNSQSIEYLLDNFFTFLDVTSKTALTYKKALKQVFNYFGQHNIKTPTRDNILAFKKELEAKGRKPATIALYLAATRRFFSWTEQSGIYPNITVGIKAPKIERGHKKDYFAAHQVKSILTGIERNDLEGLRNYAVVEDLRVVGGVSVLYIQGKGRTDKTEFIKISPQVEEAIRAYLKARGPVKEHDPLFVSCSRRNKGGRLTTRTIRGLCKNAMINAGFNSNRLTAHSLRHTAVTLALLAGQSLAEVQHFARHHNISTTQIYAHNVDRMKSQCEAVISNAIF